MTAIVLAAWIWVPAWTLGAFLAITIVHFGGDAVPRGRFEHRKHEGWLRIGAHGGGPVILPCLFYPGDVAAVFSWLVPGEVIQAQTVLAVSRPATLIWVLVALWALSRSMLRPGGPEGWEWRGALELLTVTLLFAFLPPLLSFGAYFCLMHSLHHLAEIAQDLGPGRRAQRWRWLLRQAWPLTAATVLLGLALAPVLADGLALDAVALRITFWGLAALTVPHMLLLLAWNRHRGRRAEGLVLQPREIR